MKLIFTIIVTLAVAVGLAYLAQNDPGYVVLSREPYVVRLPLLLFALIVFLTFVVLYLLLNFVSSVLRAPKQFRNWRTHNNENTAHKNTMLGYAGLIEGNWHKAENALLKKLDYNKAPLLNFLGAAYAAQQQGQLARRDEYLNEALARNPGQQVAIELTRARLKVQAGELAEARNVLEDLRETSSRNVPVVRLLADVYTELQDWASLTKLAPAMKRLNAFPEEELARREQMAYERMMASPTLTQDDQKRPQKAWKSVPAARRKDPEVIAAYARQLLVDGRVDEAEGAICKALNKKYDSGLIGLYGEVHGTYLHSQIKLAESFLKHHSDDPALHLALARLYRFKEELEKSTEHYKTAIELGSDEHALIEYSSLLEQMGDSGAALSYLKKGVAAMSRSDTTSRPADSKASVVLIEDSGESGNAERSMPLVKS